MIDPTKTKPGDRVRLVYVDENDIHRGFRVGQIVEVCLIDRDHFAIKTPNGAVRYFYLKQAEPIVEPEPSSFDALVQQAKTEATKAMIKYPQPNYVLLKIAEEAGEVVKAAIHLSEGRDSVEHVREEIKQTIAMLYRLWNEGDEVNGIPAIGADAMLEERSRTDV